MAGTPHLAQQSEVVRLPLDYKNEVKLPQLQLKQEAGDSEYQAA